MSTRTKLCPVSGSRISGTTGIWIVGISGGDIVTLATIGQDSHGNAIYRIFNTIYAIQGYSPTSYVTYATGNIRGFFEAKFNICQRGTPGVCGGKQTIIFGEIQIRVLYQYYEDTVAAIRGRGEVYCLCQPE